MTALSQWWWDRAGETPAWSRDLKKFAPTARKSLCTGEPQKSSSRVSSQVSQSPSSEVFGIRLVLELTQSPALKVFGTGLVLEFTQSPPLEVFGIRCVLELTQSPSSEVFGTGHILELTLEEAGLEP